MKHIISSVVAACAALTLVAAAAPAEASPGHAVAYHGGGYHGGGYRGGYYHGGGWYGGRGWPGYWGLGVGLGIGLGTAAYYGGGYGYGYGYPVYPAYAVAPPVVYDAPVASAPAPVVAATAPDPVIYPRNGQSAARMESDRRECNRWATSQSNAMSDGSVFQRATQACMDGRGYTIR